MPSFFATTDDASDADDAGNDDEEHGFDFYNDSMPEPKHPTLPSSEFTFRCSPTTAMDTAAASSSPKMSSSFKMVSSLKKCARTHPDVPTPISSPVKKCVRPEADSAIPLPSLSFAAAPDDGGDNFTDMPVLADVDASDDESEYEDNNNGDDDGDDDGGAEGNDGPNNVDGGELCGMLGDKAGSEKKDMCVPQTASLSITGAAKVPVVLGPAKGTLLGFFRKESAEEKETHHAREVEDAAIQHDQIKMREEKAADTKKRREREQAQQRQQRRRDIVCQQKIEAGWDPLQKKKRVSF